MSDIIPRQTFESAYAKVENTLRNYAREKLAYEETIKHLQDQLNLRDQELNAQGQEIQQLTVKNGQLLSKQTEDNIQREMVDASMTILEQKMAVLNDTNEHFKSQAGKLCERIAEMDEFNQEVKAHFQVAQQKIEEQMLKNEQLEEQTAQLNNYLQEIGTKYKQLEEELSRKNGELNKTISEIHVRGKAIEKNQEQIERLQSKMKDMEEFHKIEIQKAADTLSLEKQTYATKEQEHEKVVAELDGKIENLNMESRNAKKEVAELKQSVMTGEAKLAETIAFNQKQLDELQSKFSAEKLELTRRLNAIRAEAFEKENDTSETNDNSSNVKSSSVSSTKANSFNMSTSTTSSPSTDTPTKRKFEHFSNRRSIIKSKDKPITVKKVSFTSPLSILDSSSDSDSSDSWNIDDLLSPEEPISKAPQKRSLEKTGSDSAAKRAKQSAAQGKTTSIIRPKK